VTDKHLIVGLGNPGREYRNNRHNIGFVLLDRLVARQQMTAFTRRQGKSLITTGSIQSAPVVLAKPQTYMNLSGEAVRSLVRFYNVPLDRVLVCLDEIDLPLGRLRLRAEGGSAGHGGLKSIIEHLGTNGFPRLRVGVGRPAGSKTAAGYVLRDFRAEEYDILNATLDSAVDAVACFVTEGIVQAMNRFNAAADRA
jgi:peptidyl-tRNA hydrolase, PTH1 family